MKSTSLSIFTATAALLGCSVSQGLAQNPPPAPEPVPKWTGGVAAGLTLTRGNGDTLLSTVSAGAGKKWKWNEVSFGADGAYGESKPPGATESTVNANYAHGFAQYNRLFSDRIYAFARVEARHDDLADVAYRVALNPGAGYYFIKETNTDLCAEVGPGYVFEKLGSNENDYATLRAGEKFHYALNDRARLWQSIEWQPQVDRFNNYVVNAEIGIEADLTKDKKFALRTFLQDTYANEPAPGRKKNDVKLVTSVAYKF